MDRGDEKRFEGELRVRDRDLVREEERLFDKDRMRVVRENLERVDGILEGDFLTDERTDRVALAEGELVKDRLLGTDKDFWEAPEREG